MISGERLVLLPEDRVAYEQALARVSGDILRLAHGLQNVANSRPIDAQPPRLDPAPAYLRQAEELVRSPRSCVAMIHLIAAASGYALPSDACGET